MKKRIILTGRRATLEDVIKTLKVPKKEVAWVLKLVRRGK